MNFLEISYLECLKNLSIKASFLKSGTKQTLDTKTCVLLRFINVTGLRTYVYFVLCKAQAEMRERDLGALLRSQKAKKASNCSAIGTETDCCLCGLQGEAEETVEC
jgi:hypothetical protein